MKTDDEIKTELQTPFEEQDIEWRVQKSGMSGKKPWMLVVPYITNRAIQKRLDDVFGLFGWENVFKPAPPTIKDGKQINNWLCGITIHHDGKSVTKWDGAEETHIEPFKGGLSGAMKRTGSMMNIGRYLYQLKPVFATCSIVNSRRDCNDDYPNYAEVGKTKKEPGMPVAWANPPLIEFASWALPGIDFSEFLEPIPKAKDINELHRLFEDTYRKAQATGDNKNIELAVQAKDKRKKELEQKLIDEKKANLSFVNIWMDKQIKMFSKITNESSVKSVYITTIKPGLLERIKKYNLDGEPLLKQLKAGYDSRIKELQPKKDVKNDN